MLEARHELLGRGVYSPIAEALADAALMASRPGADAPPRSVADLGCGTGYYAAAVVARHGPARVLAADRSPDAVRMATRALGDLVPTTGVVLDLWRPLPLRDGSADLLLDVFAPRNPPEYARVLRPGGSLLVVVPTARHLAGLRESAAMLDIPGDKDAHVVEQFERVGLVLSARARVEYTLQADASTRALIAGMGPSAHHADPAREASAQAGASARRAEADASAVTVSVDVLTLSKPQA
jgi:SAM-dependent methyltransferase